MLRRGASVWLALASLALLGPPRIATAQSYLFVWAGGPGGSEFMATIDADPRSPTYGKVLASAPTGKIGAPHHTEHELAANGHLLANDFHAGETWLFDLHQPLKPVILTSFGDVGAYSHPHTFIRVANGRVLATFQYLASGEKPHSMTGAGAGMHMSAVTHSTGGLVLMDERGNPFMSGSAADTNLADRMLYPYSVLPIPAIDRALTTTTDMDHADTIATSQWIQIWRLHDLKMLGSFALAPGPRGDENRYSGEARLLADGRSIYVHTFNCGLYLVRDVAAARPVATLVHTFEGTGCGVPVLTGRFWLQTVPDAHALVALDVADPEHPRELSRVSVGDGEHPHWISIDRAGKRVVMNSGGRGDRLFIIDLDRATGRLSLDQRFHDAGSELAGISLEGANWPRDFNGKVTPHGAVFSR